MQGARKVILELAFGEAMAQTSVAGAIWHGNPWERSLKQLFQSIVDLAGSPNIEGLDKICSDEEKSFHIREIRQ